MYIKHSRPGCLIPFLPIIYPNREGIRLVETSFNHHSTPAEILRHTGSCFHPSSVAVTYHWPKNQAIWWTEWPIVRAHKQRKPLISLKILILVLVVVANFNFDKRQREEYDKLLLMFPMERILIKIINISNRINLLPYQSPFHVLKQWR